MKPPLLSLAHMCVLELTPPEVISCAAEAGFSAVNLRLSPAREGERQHPMIGDTPMRRDAARRLADTGLQVLDVEVIWLRPDTKAADHAGLFDAAATLNARRVIAACADADHARAADTFARVCELAGEFQLGVDLEFMIFSEAKNLRQALAITRAAGQPNGGILVDALHVARSGTRLDEVAALDPGLLSFFQLCDAPAHAPADVSALGFEARFDRLLPGEGGLPLDELLASLPHGLDVSVEVPLSGDRGRLSALERARLLQQSAAHFLSLRARSLVRTS